MRKQEMNARPLATFGIITFNQEKFVREAVQSAFDQTYQPLEIILSDDRSGDATYDIMKSLVNSYDGPSRILLNRNKENIGIGAHINKVVEMSSGEFIVIAAGDDISLRNRTATLVNAWLENDKKFRSVHSDALVISENGSSLGQYSIEYSERLTENIANHEHVIGATHGWSREVFDVFGPLNSDVVNEDVVIPIRSKLLGGVLHLKEALVKYRQAESSWLETTDANKQQKLYEINEKYAIPYYQQIWKDITTFKKYAGNPVNLEGIEQLTIDKLEELHFLQGLLQAGAVRNLLNLTQLNTMSAPQHNAYKRYLKQKFPFIRRLNSQFRGAAN